MGEIERKRVETEMHRGREIETKRHGDRANNNNPKIDILKSPRIG